METLRKALRGYTVRALLALLVLSFVLWGVRSDFGYLASTQLAKIGGTSITTDQYSSLFSEELQRLAVETGRNITPEDARRAGLDQRLLAKLKLDEHARQMGLSYSEQGVLDRLTRNGDFNKADGSFDRDGFRNRVNNMGYSEAGFFASERREAVRSQVMDTVAAASPPSSVLLDAVNIYQGEQRVIEYAMVPEDKAKKPDVPDEGKLKAFYEERKPVYMAPEYRRVFVMTADPQKLKDKVNPTDDELKKVFEADKEALKKADKRRVEQIVFPDLAAAQKAHAELVKGKDFLEVAKAAKQSAAEIDRGLLAKSDIIDQKAAAAIWTFGAQTFTLPVEGDLSVAIWRVRPPEETTFEAVKANILERVKVEKATAQLTDLVTKVEDLRSAAKTMDEIAKEIGLPIQEFAAVDKTGKGKDGKDAGVPGAAQVLEIAFGKEPGVESDAINRGQDGYAWVDLKEVIPTRQKTYDEVKDQVKDAWMAAETTRALTELSRGLVAKVNDGASLEAVLKDLGLTAKKSQAFTRRQNSDDLPGPGVKLAFAVAKGAAGTVPAADGKSRLVFKVTEVTPPKPMADADRKKLAEQLQTLMAADQQAQYFEALTGRLGVSIDQSVFQRMAGGGTEP